MDVISTVIGFGVFIVLLLYLLLLGELWEVKEKTETTWDILRGLAEQNGEWVTLHGFLGVKTVSEELEPGTFIKVNEKTAVVKEVQDAWEDDPTIVTTEGRYDFSQIDEKLELNTDD